MRINRKDVQLVVFSCLLVCFPNLTRWFDSALLWAITKHSALSTGWIFFFWFHFFFLIMHIYFPHSQILN